MVDHHLCGKFSENKTCILCTCSSRILIFRTFLDFWDIFWRLFSNFYPTLLHCIIIERREELSPLLIFWVAHLHMGCMMRKKKREAMVGAVVDGMRSEVIEEKGLGGIMEGWRGR